MSDETVANLGFAVNSQPLEEAKTKLSGVTTEAQKTGKAVDGLNQSFAKVGDAVGKSATSLNEVKQGAAAATASLTAHSNAVKQSSESHRGLSSQSQAAAHAIRSMAESISLGVSPVQALTQQINHLSYAASGEGGLTGAFSGIGRMLGAGGVIGVAVAAATAAFLGLDQAISGAAQEVEQSRKKFESLGGIRLGDQYSASLEKLTKDLGVTREAIAPTYESLLKLVSLRNPEGGIQILGPGLPDMLDKAKINADSLTSSLKAVFEQLKLGGSDTKSATDATVKLFDEIIKKGELTGDALRKLQDSGTGGARAAQTIANAFTGGMQNAQQYAAALDKVPVPLTKILETLPKIEAGSRAAFQELENSPKTVTAALEGLSKSFGNLWDKITGADKPQEGAANVSLITRAISAAADAVNRAAPSIVSAIDSVKSAIASITSPMGTVLSAIKGFVDGALGYFDQLAQGAIAAAKKAASAIASIASGGAGSALSGNTDALGNPTSGNTDGGGNIIGGGSDAGVLSPSGDAGTIDLGSIDQGLITDAFATGGGFTVGGDGGVDTTLVQFKATKGEKVDVYHGDKPSGTPINGAAARQGELLASRISNAEREQTFALVDAIDASAGKITDAVNALGVSLRASSSASTGGGISATGSSVTAAAATSSSGLPDLRPTGLLGSGATGGAGFTTRPNNEDDFGNKKQSGADKEDNPKDEPRLPPNMAQQLAAAGLSAGMANAIRGASFGRTNTQAGKLVGSAGDGRGPDGLIHPTFKEAVDQNGLPLAGTGNVFGPPAPLAGERGSPFEGPVFRDIKDGTDKTNRSLEDIKGSSDRTIDEVSGGAQRTVNALDSASSSIANAVTSSGASLGDMFSSAISSLGNAISNVLQHGSIGGGGGGGGGNGGVSSISGGSDGSGSSGTNWDGSTDANWSDSSGDGNSIDTGIISNWDGGVSSGDWSISDSGGGFDTGAIDYGGGSADMGYFATGGQFKVGGDGGIDTTPVFFHATKGETVTITPPNSVAAPPSGVAVSPMMLNPAAQNDNASAPAPASQTNTKIVNMYLHPGIQAEQFIRSRAQVARGM